MPYRQFKRSESVFSLHRSWSKLLQSAWLGLRLSLSSPYCLCKFGREGWSEYVQFQGLPELLSCLLSEHNELRAGGMFPLPLENPVP